MDMCLKLSLQDDVAFDRSGAVRPAPARVGDLRLEGWCRGRRRVVATCSVMAAPGRAANADDSGTIQEKMDGAKRRLQPLVSFRG
jgi:hypothetical protein